MKFYKLLIVILVFSFFAVGNVSVAQFLETDTTEESEEPEEMDEEEWEKQMIDLMTKKDALTKQIEGLQKDNDLLKTQNEEKLEELKKTEDALWNEVGGKDAYIKFKFDLESLERICRNKEGSKADVLDKVEEMNKSRARCHPELFTRFNSLKKCLDSWQSSVPEYTVVRGDYLFVISARKDVYNHPRYWPVIWEANEYGVISAPRGIPKTIRNPHLVYPGQVLKIPQLTESLKKSGIFDRAKEWTDGDKNRIYKRKR
ncbi:MAG: LysM peptidoglycan-binding domain-containing protein [Ignavibacteria bacterium]|nr:LysM peptidoglycan-binding domain-containing protein [Ignavibacteria bacterium]